MKKQLKYILITLVAALVVGLGALAAVVFVPDAPDTTSSTLTSQEVYVYEKDSTSVVKFTVTNQYGSYEMVPKESGNFHIVELDPYETMQSYMNSLVTTYSSLKAKKLVTENPEDLSLYGFDEPLATLKAEFSDETFTVIIGNGETTTNGYYCKLEGEDKVYLLSSGIGGRLLSNKYYYIDKVITPSYDTNTELSFDRLVLSGSFRDEDIVIVPTPDSKDDYAEIFGYEIISPATAPLNLTTGNDFLTSFFVMTAEDVVALSPNEETLKEYGFDNPYSVAEVRSSAGNFTVKVGKVDGDYCYVMSDSEDVVFRVPKASIAWLEVLYPDIISDIFLVPHIQKVSSLEFKTPDKTYQFEVGYDYTNSVVLAKCDDRYVNSENFQSLYQVCVSAYLETYNTERVEGEPSLTLTYTYIEGGEDYIEFFTSKNDPRQSIIKLNGEYTDFSVRTVYVEKLINDCPRLLRGETISTTW